MKLIIKSKIRVTEAIREHCLRRFHFALGRFGNIVEAVTIRITDINGPKGGIDKMCKALVLVVGKGTLVMEETHSDLYVAIDRICGRLGTTVARKRGYEKQRWAPVLVR